MAALQTTLPFRVRKKSSLSFYSKKVDSEKSETFHAEDEKKTIRNVLPSPPKIRKIIELDSDDENIDLTNIGKAQRSLKRLHPDARTSKVNQACSDEASESDCSPSKISRDARNSKSKNILTNRPISQLSLTSENNKIKCDENEFRYENSCNLRQALHSSSSSQLPGRQSELNNLEAFLNDHLEQHTSGTLYVSGPPGTGKTACLSHILDRPKYKKGFKEVYVNCTTMKSAGSIFGRICQELHIKTTGHNEKAFLKAIDKYLASKHNMILLVLDEIDQLCNKKQSVLYTIFEWPARKNSNLVLVGIANALDLTDRILPRLQVRCELKPKLMHFAPYTKQQIVEIFTERLKQEITLDLFSPNAIQMLAGKVAAISGDVRRALDIGRRVVELATAKAGRDKIKSGALNIDLQTVLSVLSDVYGASQKLEADVDDSFPLQQKLLICSLLLILNKGKNKDITVGKLHDIYSKVCKKRNIASLDSTEFFGLCGLVESRGIICLSGKKEPRTNKVVLQWDEAEVSRALSDKKMISDIINDISCLEK